MHCDKKSERKWHVNLLHNRYKILQCNGDQNSACIHMGVPESGYDIGYLSIFYKFANKPTVQTPLIMFGYR